MAAYGAFWADISRSVGGAAAGLVDLRGTALSTLDDLDESIDVADKYGWKEGLSRQIGVRQMYEAALDVSFDTGEAFDNQMDRVRHFSDGLARTSGTIGTVAGVGAGVQRFATPRVANVPGNAGRFPAEPDDFTKMLGVDPKVSTTKHGTRRYLWEPNSNTRIRFESHPGDTGAFNPRHHGEHYHIDVKPDNMTWNQAKKQNLITKVKPEDYILGHGTGHLPGELFPGQ